MQALHPKLFVTAAHATGASVVGLALLLYYALVFMPLDRQERLDVAQGDRLQLGLNDSLEVRREHMLLTRRLEKLNELAEAARNQLPSVSAESQFLTTVTQAAESNTIELTDYRRNRQEVAERHIETWVIIRGTGSHASICRFIDTVNDFPHAAILAELAIDSTGNPFGYPFEATYTLYHDAAPRQARAASENDNR